MCANSTLNVQPGSHRSAPHQTHKRVNGPTATRLVFINSRHNGLNRAERHNSRQPGARHRPTFQQRNVVNRSQRQLSPQHWNRSSPLPPISTATADALPISTTLPGELHRTPLIIIILRPLTSISQQLPLIILCSILPILVHYPTSVHLRLPLIILCSTLQILR